MNPYEIPNLRFTLGAGADVANHRFVSPDANSNGIQTEAGEAAIGVSMCAAASGKVLEIADGIVMVTAGDTVTPGQTVQSDATGRAVPKTTGMGLGVAITGGTVGLLIAVKLLCVSAVDGDDGSNGADANPLQLVSYTTSDLGAGADLAATPIWACPAGFTALIKGATLISLGTADGIDADNTCVVAVNDGTTDQAAETFDAVTAFPASGVALALPLAAIELDAGDVLTLAVTNGTAANPPAMIVQLHIELTEVA